MTATVIGEWSEVPHSFAGRYPLAARWTGTRGPDAEDRSPCTDRRLQRAPRHDRRGRPRLPAPAGAGAPIIVDGDMWGWMAAADTTVPRYLTRSRIGSLSSPSWSRRPSRTPRAAAALGRLAEEQAALRRVATLVAQGTRPEEVFAAVAKRSDTLFSVEVANAVPLRVRRHAHDPRAARTGRGFPVGEPLAGWEADVSLATLILETRPSGAARRLLRMPPARSLIAARERGHPLGRRDADPRRGPPVGLDGRRLAARSSSLPADTEARLALFTELVATAIANAEARTGAGGVAGADRGGGRRRSAVGSYGIYTTARSRASCTRS